MKQKQKPKPPLYRLTLKQNAVTAFSELLARQEPPRLVLTLPRTDGRYDVGISMALLDQLQTAALSRENLSDTVLRVMSAKAGT